MKIGVEVQSLFVIFIKEITLLGMGTFVLLDEKNDTKEGIYIFIRIFVESQFSGDLVFIYFLFSFC